MTTARWIGTALDEDHFDWFINIKSYDTKRADCDRAHRSTALHGTTWARQSALQRTPLRHTTWRLQGDQPSMLPHFNVQDHASTLVARAP